MNKPRAIAILGIVLAVLCSAAGVIMLFTGSWFIALIDFGAATLNVLSVRNLVRHWDGTTP